MKLSVASTAAALLFYGGVVDAAQHHLFVSSYRTQHLFALTYDEEMHSITMEKEIVAHSGHPIMQFNHDKSVLYASERQGFTSYMVGGKTELYFASHIQLPGTCLSKNGKRGQTSFAVSKQFPYRVYGASRNKCGVVMSVRDDGALDKIAQNYTLRAESKIKGMAIDREAKILYSADSDEEGIWVHKVDQNGFVDKGRVAEMPVQNTRLQRILVHPNGRYLYVLWRKLNKIAVFESVPRNNANSPPQIKYTNITIDLVPSGVPDAQRYRANEISLSEDGRLLFASVIWRPDKKDDESGEGEEDDEDADYSTAPSPYAQGTTQVPQSLIDAWRNMLRGKESKNSGNSGKSSSSKTNKNSKNSKRAPVEDLWPAHPDFRTPLINKVHIGPKIMSHKRQASNPPGFITAILLSDPDNGQKGYPLQVVMQVATITGGGKANVVTPAPWANDQFALSDTERGLVQIWQLEGLANLPRDGPHSAHPSIPLSMTGNSRGQNAGGVNIRAAIVAEWIAPPQAVGDPNEPNTRSSSTKRFAKMVAASLTKRKATGTRAASAIPSGRGCCANAIWLD